MSSIWNTIPNARYQQVGMFAVLAFFITIELIAGRFWTRLAAKNDWKIEALSVLQVVILHPLMLVSVFWLGTQFFPEYRNALAWLPGWPMFLIFLIGDDMVQYWWHRISHTPTLWPLHRVHHSTSYMGVRVAYRNNLFYYAPMPNLWITATLIYLGFFKIYVIYAFIKLMIIIGAHSSVRWDEALYKIRVLRPLMWVLERTISTPATHWAHHALTMDDGIGNYKGNFGNMLFFWDILFGTALITRKYPAEIGLRDDKEHGKEIWYIELFYPIFKSKRINSALSKDRIIVE